MGEMKKMKVNFTLDPLAEMRPARKKAILANKKLKAAIEKLKVEYKETIIADSKKWDAKKLEKALQRNVAVMELKMFDTACKDLEGGQIDKKLEDQIIKSHKSLMKRIQKNVNEQMETVINDKPDDKKLKKGVAAFKKLDGGSAKKAFSDYAKWMKKCEKNWSNIQKLEEQIEEQEKAGGGGEAGGNEDKVLSGLKSKRDTLLSECKSYYKEETGQLFKSLDSIASQYNEILGFQREMKRSSQISDEAQKAITSAKGMFKSFKENQTELKKARNAFETTMKKLERAKKASQRPAHAQFLVQKSLTTNFEKTCKEAEGLHKKLAGFYKAAK